MWNARQRWSLEKSRDDVDGLEWCVGWCCGVGHDLKKDENKRNLV